MGALNPVSQETLRRNPESALDVPPVRRYADKSETHKTFQAHNGYLERVELFAPQSGQNLRNALSQGSGIGAAYDSGCVLAGEANEIPVCLADLPI